MKIIDILSDSATLLGLNDEFVALQSATQESEKELISSNSKISSLFTLIQFSIRELCTNYVPMFEEIRILTKDKKFPLSSLERFIHIRNVFKGENLIKFKVINRNLVFEEDGEYTVSYATYPKINSMFEECDFLNNFSPDVIVFGLCAYYSIANGLFNEFEDFHEKYIAKAESLKNLKNFRLPTRRWE